MRSIIICTDKESISVIKEKMNRLGCVKIVGKNMSHHQERKDSVRDVQMKEKETKEINLTEDEFWNHLSTLCEILNDCQGSIPYFMLQYILTSDSESIKEIGKEFAKIQTLIVDNVDYLPGKRIDDLLVGLFVGMLYSKVNDDE